MPIVLILAVIAAVGAFALHAKSSGGRPAPAPQRPPAGSLGQVPTQVDSAGFTVVIPTPGYMGTLNLGASMASSSVGQQTNFLDVQTPGGTIQNVASSNVNVLGGGQAGSSSTSSVALGSATMPGQTVITVNWTDSSGTAQVSSFTVTAT